MTTEHAPLSVSARALEAARIRREEQEREREREEAERKEREEREKEAKVAPLRDALIETFGETEWDVHVWGMDAEWRWAIFTEPLIHPQVFIWVGYPIHLGEPVDHTEVRFHIPEKHTYGWKPSKRLYTLADLGDHLHDLLRQEQMKEESVGVDDG